MAQRKELKSTKQKKEQFLKAFVNNNCNISEAAKAVGINRRSFYNWCEADKKFEDAIMDARESIVDMAEVALIKNIKEGKETSLIFYLKTKGKERGYVERTEQKVEQNLISEIKIIEE